MKQALGVAILSVSPRVVVEDDRAGARLEANLGGEVRVVARAHFAGSGDRLHAQLASWIADRDIDLIIAIGADAAAERALAPLVDDWLEQPAERWRALVGARAHAEVAATQVACCGSKLVVLAHELAATHVPVAAAPPPIPAVALRPRALTTTSIAAIGDLPSLAAPLEPVRGGRKATWIAGTVACGVIAVCAVASAQMIRRSEVSAATAIAATAPVLAAPAAREPIAAAPESPPPAVATLATPTRPPVAARDPRPAAPHRDAIAKPAVHAIAATETPPVAPPATAATATDAAPTGDPNACTQASCAADGNERPCCTPYRGLAAKLDRTAIADAMASARGRARDCGSGQVVRVAVDVEPSGQASRTIVLEAVDADVGACVAAALRATPFPPTTGGGSFVARLDLSR